MVRVSVCFILSLLLAGRVFADSRLTNVSVRSTAGSDSNTLIVGFTIAGTGSKQMLVRGIGPTLATFGVDSVVADPALALNSVSAKVATNDNWGGTPTLVNAFASVGAFPLPTASTDAAIFQLLPSGSYTAVLSATGSPRVALVEAYDADSGTSTTAISNISARSLAGTGANVLTVGFAISGTTPKTVLIRAVGPGLTAYGVTGALTDPQLKLFSNSGAVLGYNDDWLLTAGWTTVFDSVGAFQFSRTSADAALVVTLAPGIYTAQANGFSNTTGVALIEVYDVPNPPATAFVYQPVENVITSNFTAGFADKPRAVTPPVVLTQAAPVYPTALRVADAEGDVLIDFIVGSDGRVADAIIVNAMDVRLGQAALDAVRKWTFQAGRDASGQPAWTLLQVPVVFHLNG
jgi:TonB family protein